MAIQKETWLRDIAGNIFPNNEFFMRSIDDTPFVVDGKTVHIPQAGAKPTVEKNRTTLPATVSKRTDTLADYDLDEFSTDPILLQDTEEVEVSYAKRQNLLTEQTETLNEEIADNFAYLWTPSLATNIVRTTGAARAATSTGATGTRKAVTKADILELRRIMNRMDIPQAGRYLLIPSDMENDILNIDGFVDADKIGSAKLIEGVIGRIAGFNIYSRSKSTVYDNTGTPVAKAPGAASAATDNLSILAWHDKYVCRAKGEVVLFAKEDDPTYYGDIFSAIVRAGGRKRRTDQKGVLALVETWVS